MINKNIKKSKQKKETYEIQIDSIEKTSDTLSDRAGLALFYSVVFCTPFRRIQGTFQR
jgi:hypothetical protein